MNMPRIAVVAASLTCAAVIASPVGFAQPSPPQSSSSQPSLDELRGDWLGVARFSDGRELRMGLEIMRKADGSTGANVSMPDRGVAFVAVSAISLEKDQLALRLDGPGLTIDGTVSEDGTTITGAGTQRGRSDRIVFRRVSSLPPIGRERPQTPRPPFPYEAEEVAFENSVDHVWLSGTLTKPIAHGAFPAAIFVGGSGANQRDYDLDGHRLPVVIADYLARRGFAVLRYDKRGVYKSTGNYAAATDDDFVRDALAAYDYLLRRAEIDRRKIGYIGHSEGSSVSARAVVLRGGTAGFIVSMAGVGLARSELNHMFQTAKTGATDEYQRIDETVAPPVLQVIGDWLGEVLR